jgi:sugar/nucleoside kinase (ribokinase family)
MMENCDVLVGGHICLDVHAELRGWERKPFEQVFIPGHVVFCGSVSFSPGGAVANTGLVLNRLGIATRLVGNISDDLFGQALC